MATRERRRTTLANVSSASLNSRVSTGAASSRATMSLSKQQSSMAASNPSRYSMSTAGVTGGRLSAAARPSMGSKRTSTGRPSMGRPSMAAGERKSSTGVRRSSAYGNGGGARSDSRPLMDKAFLNSSLHKLADYLSSHGYDQPINAKTLSRPSGRDFNNIMGFLFRQVDPNYKPSGRFEDDVIPFLKMLRYPFTLSRSSLAAVGAPQTWPKVMGAISWIVETLLAEEAVAEAEEEQQLRREHGADDEADLEDEELNEQSAALKEYMDYLRDAYSYFLEGDDDAHTALSEDYMNARDVEIARCEERAKDSAETSESLAERFRQLQKEGDSLPELEEALALAQSDRDKYVSLEEQLKAHLHKLQEKIEKRKEEEAKLKEALVTVEEAQAALQQQIARQEFSADDVERHLAERRRLREAMSNATKAKSNARKEGWAAQEEALKSKELLKEALHNFEEKAKGLLLIPNGTQPAKNCGSTNFEVSLVEHKLDDESGILSNDVKGIIRPAINELKVAIMRRTQGFREDLSNLLVEEDKVEEEITDVETELEVLQKQVRLKEMTYSKEKQALDQKMVAMRRRLEDEERRLDSVQAAEDLDRLTAEGYETIDALRIQIEDLKERQETELKEGENILHTALETALDYKEREERGLAGLKEMYRQHLDAMKHGETTFDIIMAEDEVVAQAATDSDEPDDAALKQEESA